MGINNTNELPKTSGRKNGMPCAFGLEFSGVLGLLRQEVRGKSSFTSTCYDNTIGERNSNGVSISVDIYTGKRWFLSGRSCFLAWGVITFLHWWIDFTKWIDLTCGTPTPLNCQKHSAEMWWRRAYSGDFSRAVVCTRGFAFFIPEYRPLRLLGF